MSKIANFFIAGEQNNFRPPVLSYKAFLIYGLILLILRLLLGTLPVSGAAVESGTLMNLINQERGNRNLATLFTHQSLVLAASRKSQDMIDRDYFDHVDPDGNYVWGKIVAAGYSPYKILGENLAVDFSTSEGMVKAWIDSPTHRANLLNNDFVDQGLTALYGDFQGRFTNLTASLFGTLAVTQKPPPLVKAYPSPSAPAAYPSPYTTPYATPYPTPQTAAPITETTPTSVVSKLPDLTKPILSVPDVPATTPFQLSRIIFTAFGLGLLAILGIDSVIIYRRRPEISRSHSSYHFMSLMLITLISILIWWW